MGRDVEQSVCGHYAVSARASHPVILCVFLAGKADEFNAAVGRDEKILRRLALIASKVMAGGKYVVGVGSLDDLSRSQIPPDNTIAFPMPQEIVGDKYLRLADGAVGIPKRFACIGGEYVEHVSAQCCDYVLAGNKQRNRHFMRRLPQLLAAFYLDTKERLIGLVEDLSVFRSQGQRLDLAADLPDRFSGLCVDS